MKIRNLTLVITSIASLGFAAPSLAGSSAPAGDPYQATVTKVVRQVEWQRYRTTAWQKAAVDNLLLVGDTLRTGAEAKAELLYGDGSVTRVGSMTSLTLTGDGKRELHLDGGRVWLHIRKGSVGMKVITPGAVAAITGTELMVDFDPIKHTTEVTVFEGSVNVTGDVGNLVRVLGGTTTFVPPHAPAAAPLPLDERKIQERENIFRPLSVPSGTQNNSQAQPDTKQPETKQNDSKQPESKQNDSKQSDTKSSETKSSDAKSTEAKSSDAKSNDSKSSDSKSSDSKSSDSKSSDSKSSDSKSSDSKSSDAKSNGSTETKSTDAKQPDAGLDHPTTQATTGPVTNAADHPDAAKTDPTTAADTKTAPKQDDVKPDLKGQTKTLMDPRLLNGSPTSGRVKVIVE